MNYPSIRIEGAILSPDILDRIEELPGQKPADFGLDSSARVKDEIARAWADAQDYWRIFQRKLEALKQDSPATTETRQQWVVPLLGLLGYQLEYQARGVELNGKSYAISHRAVNRAQAPVHIVGYREPAGLDRKPERSNVRMSAHAVVQELINLNEQLYGIITNGRVLRLLRDSSRLIKQSYLEFDLDRIFTDGLFSDFAILFRLLHATRIPATNEGAAESLIERYHQDSLDSGARIREGLSKAVEDAILTFGNGFLAHPANAHLREQFTSGQLSADAYYTSLLRLIYRLLFLMVIEERGLVFPPAAAQRQRETYARFYSVQRLRNLSQKRYLADRRQSDLWLALRSTFRLFEGDGLGATLGLKPLAGDLFRSDAIGALADAQLGNDALLACLRSLTVYENPENKQLIRVNYAALNVEEFGSVYEGLLEYEPTVDTTTSLPTFGFRPGDERGATGSHYTPDDLVQPLIKNSLDKLITGQLKTPHAEAGLLNLRVADIACGSGHILLAAARRIATELAVVRTGEEQPSPSAYRTALRDTIRTCIYGVDLNPLAVELCKVALWLEAHNPGEPLNFLDHHIKCGNAIGGFVKRGNVDNGIPDAAFAKRQGDDADVGNQVRARNKRERKVRKTGAFPFTNERHNEIASVLSRWKAITAMPERTPAEIASKKDEFDSFSSSGAAWALKQIASIPLAQFYVPRTKDSENKLITDSEFSEYWSGSVVPQGAAPSTAFAIAARERFFHWFLEFPEIVQRGGFDCVLGNPPYLGGNRIANRLGGQFAELIKAEFECDGNSNFVVYFIRRAYELLRSQGYLAVIASQSIKEGTSRLDGLAKLMGDGGAIVFARRNLRWPGEAATNVDLVSIFKGEWMEPRELDGKQVTWINSALGDNVEDAEPTPLHANTESSFVGVALHGDGFILGETEAKSMLAVNRAYKTVIKPFLIGDDLISSPIAEASRFAIDFSEHSIESAATFVTPFELVRERVLPERQQNNRPARKKYWWQFGEKATGLRGRIAEGAPFLVTAKTAKHLAFLRLQGASSVLDQSLTVLALPEWNQFAVLQSTIHELWARAKSSNQGGTPRYNATTAFCTFPLPELAAHTRTPTLDSVGERYYERRRRLMLSLWLGITDLYNMFHARNVETELKKHFADVARKDPGRLKIPEEHRAAVSGFAYDAALTGILELRSLRVELDAAVLAAYGWNQPSEEGQAVVLGHGFHDVETLPENDRTRFTVSPAARGELLVRLLKENHRRAAREDSATATSVKPKQAKGSSKDEGDLFA